MNNRGGFLWLITAIYRVATTRELRWWYIFWIVIILALIFI